MEAIEIDGSYGEGGGQILRTSLTLSILTGKPVRIHHIRAGRKPPGLRPQHLMSTQAAAQICGGKLEGAGLGSLNLSFHPGRVRSGNYIFDVASLKASAGSTTLILQTLLPPLGFAEGSSHILLKGGTHVSWCPPADYLKDIFLPTLAAIGIQVKMEAPQKGFYPVGGGILDAVIIPFRTPLKPLRIQERGRLKRIRILSTVANLPLSIAKRQMDRAVDLLAEHGLKSMGEVTGVESPGKGTFCFILTEFEQVQAGFSALGKIGKRAERVAEEAVASFLHYWHGQGAVEQHLADQVALYMALAEGMSAITVSEMTDHLKTNIWVIEQFLPVRFSLKEDPAGTGILVQVKGIGLEAPSTA